MARLKTIDKQILEKLFRMGSGNVLNFSYRTIGEFFKDSLGVDIFDPISLLSKLAGIELWD